MNQYKVISIIIGIGITIGFLISYLQSKSTLDILFISIGIIMVINGFYIQNKKPVTLIAMVIVNVIQWLIVIYTLLFIGQIYPFGDFLIFLSIAPVTTISLFTYHHRRGHNSINNHQKTKNDTILNNKLKIVLIFVGFLVTVIFLASFIFSGSPLELFCSSVGLMIIVYGFYREGKENIGVPIEYTPGVSHLAMYRESKNVNITVNYFLAMTSILIFQLLIIFYITAYYPAEQRDMPFIFIITFWVAFFFYIQIRESDLKYIGKRREKTTGKMRKNPPIIPNEKKEKLIGISAVVLFIVIIGAYLIIAGNQNVQNSSNIAGDKNIISNYSITDTSYNINSNLPTKTFSYNEISFNYPYDQYDPMNNISWIVNSEGSNIIIASKKNGYNEVQFKVQVINNNGTPEENVIKTFQGSVTPGWNKNANYKITIDNKTAYEDIYTSKENQYNKLMKFTRIILVKNDKTYLIFLQAPESDFDIEKPNFAVILNSFKVY